MEIPKEDSRSSTVTTADCRLWRSWILKTTSRPDHAAAGVSISSSGRGDFLIPTPKLPRLVRSRAARSSIVCAGVSFGKPRFLEPMVGGRISANHPWHTGRPRNQHGLGEDILLYVSRESVTGQRSNRLVRWPNQELGQRVFRDLCVTHPILSGPYQADKSRSHSAARSQALTSTP